ncbi:MAG TPA: DedA family protein [Acidiferrobacter sp.]|nr:DedA family protein [Acidiferrobacter sp.]
MSLIKLIHVYGYLAVLIGCFLEGETILLLGGMAAEQGYLSLPGVIVAAFLGSMTGDQLFFYIGRRYGPDLIERKPRLKKAATRMQGWMVRWGTLLILGFRFLYGMRSAAPFVFGVSGIGRWRFAILNAIGAAVWAIALGFGGYFAGQAFAVAIVHLKHYELAVLGLAALGAGVWLLSRYRS